MADVPNSNGKSAPQLAADNKSVTNQDKFWFQDTIEGARWNLSFPYQLLVVKKKGAGWEADKNWQFTLPLPPESISISMPIAAEANITQGGVVEEHSGAPVRIITATGTTGVLPLRPASEQRQSFNAAQAIFAGTLSAARQTTRSAIDLANNFDPNISNNRPNLLKDDDLGARTSLNLSSGYYQFHLLQRFIEDYLAFKKTKKGRNYTMAFAMWKDKAVYLVTPKSFDVRKAAPDVWEYKYSLTWKAFARVQLNGPGPLADAFRPAVYDPNVMAQMMNTLEDARRVLQGARATLLAVGGDVTNTVFEPLREVGLFAKDLLGVPLAFSDLPNTLINDARGAIIEYVSVRDTFNGADQLFADKSQETRDLYISLGDLGAAMGKGETLGGDPAEFNQALNQDPANDLFEHPENHYEFLQTLKPGDLNLAPSTIRSIVHERERVQKLTRLDFEKLRDTLIQSMTDFSDFVGAGSVTYNTIYGRPLPTTTRVPTDEDYQIIFALNRAAIELNRLAATGKTDTSTLSAMEVVAGLASRSGIAFKIPRSKMSIPFPYGATLERLAEHYLGNADRWEEIAVLNGLKTPYVDEEGFDLPLLVNGAGNQVMVSDATRLYVGQPVWISATTTARTKRRIAGIRVLSENQAVITLDGDSDLARFQTLAGAEVHAYLPDTVNSGMTLFIPSEDEPGVEDFEMKAIPGVDEFDELVEIGGIDLMITQKGDACITQDGDWKLAVGLANIVQKAKIRLALHRGDLLQHPQIGLTVKAGMSTADLSVQELLNACRELFADDPTFSGVQAVAIKKTAVAAQIGMSVGIRNRKNQNIPITVNLTK